MVVVDERDGSQRGRDCEETTRFHMNKINSQVLKCCAAKSEATAVICWAQIIFGLGQILCLGSVKPQYREGLRGTQ